MSLKILNLYAGIGGNRKLWTGDIEVTAVEIVPEIAKIYQDFFPQDKVVIADAHQYLLEHYEEYDFIWSSPPCPTHSRMRLLKKEQNAKEVYPDMKLWQEVVFLKSWFKGKWVVENVISYYEPFIECYESNNHYFWTNFPIGNLKKTKRGLIRVNMSERIEYMQEDLGFSIDHLKCSQSLKSKVLSNCVKPNLGLHIFKCAFRIKQQTLDKLEGQNK